MDSQAGGSPAGRVAPGPGRKLLVFATTLIIAMITAGAVDFFVSGADLQIPELSPPYLRTLSRTEILKTMLLWSSMLPFACAFLLAWFPAGFAFTGGNAAIPACFLGWILYGSLTLLALRTRRRKTFALLYAIFVVLLMVNVVGCQGVSSWGTL